MVDINRIRDECINAYQLLLQFLYNNPAIEDMSVSTLVYFLDTKELYTGITSNSTGEDWIIELNGIILTVKDSRVDAEIYVINEAFDILEKSLTSKTIRYEQTH